MVKVPGQDLKKKLTPEQYHICGAHLGDVFDDLPADATALQAGGPKEKTGKRYCINSAALDFKAK